MPALLDVQLPSPDTEIWRYSRIEELNLSRYEIGAATPSVANGTEFVTFGADQAGRPTSPDVFADLNAEHMSAATIDVPAGVDVAEPIVLVHTAVDGAAEFPRTTIRLGANARCTVIERFTSAAGAQSFVSPLLSIDAGAGSSLTYLAVNDVDESSWQIGHQLVDAGRDASVSLSTITLGGYYTRVRTEVSSREPGSSIRQVALYFAAGDQMHDFRVIQNHIAPHTSSDLLFKGAVQDTARSVYTGLISIGEDAKGTSANQTNRNLTLSEGAWAESVPNLDIRNNDVRCSHASTVGPIDAEQRYYLESRGLPPVVAERLVVLGFFDEVLAQLPEGDIVNEVRARVASKLSLGGVQ